MDLFRRTLLVFLSILGLGWLSLQFPLYEYLGMAGILLPGFLFGLPFSVVNFRGRQKKIRGAIATTLFATVSIVAGFLLAFSFGPEGAGSEGMKYGLLLGFSCAAPLTILIFAVYGLSWPFALLAIVLGSLLPALAGFEEAGETHAKPEFFAYFWLAVMGAVYTLGVRKE